ncbi:MAG TPA: hypothetical protein VIE15_04465 [Acidimicrobiales bacterium]
MGSIELEQFSLRDGVGREAFCELDSALQAWSYVHREGLRRRTTAFGEGRDVLVVSVFSGWEPPPRPTADDDGPVAAFVGAIEASTYRRAVYADRG